MLILAFDTSTPAVTVALRDAERTLAQTMDVDARRHGELLAPAIARVLTAAGVTPADLTALAVGAGPGPFTGLRVGLVTAATLADALGIPAHPVCSLDVVADAHPGPVVVATDARRREVYWAVYDADCRRVHGPAVDRPADVAAWLDARPEFAGVPLAGDGALLHAEAFAGRTLHPHDRYPQAARLAEMIVPQVELGATPAPLTPIYLRRPDAVPPGPRKQVTPA